MGAIAVTKQACDDEVLGANTTLKFDVPTTLKKTDKLTFYCKANDCNVQEEIKKIIKGYNTKTIEAIKAANKAAIKAPGADTTVAGAAQSTVAIATIAFSVVMARLAL